MPSPQLESLHRDVIVVGASAGGIEALQRVVEGLPADLDAAVLVVLHMSPTGGTALERILSRAGSLPVHVAQDGEPLLPGQIYLASGDCHLLVSQKSVRVRKGPRENGHRPAVDPLFRSAAVHYGPRAIGVILSGSLHDGTAGLYAIKRNGGLAVVQDPDDALYDSMPSNAVQYVAVDHVAKASEMGPLLQQLVQEEFEPTPAGPERLLELEVELMERDDHVVEEEHPGAPSPWPCPDCNGVLWEIQDGPILRFRCRVGHAWAAEALVQEQGESIEAALWMALRALEDRAALNEKLAIRAEEQGRHWGAGRHREDLAAMRDSIDTLRRLLAHQPAGFEVLDESGDA